MEVLSDIECVERLVWRLSIKAIVYLVLNEIVWTIVQMASYKRALQECLMKKNISGNERETVERLLLSTVIELCSVYLYIEPTTPSRSMRRNLKLLILQIW